MRSEAENKAMADELVAIIRKHGGWMEGDMLYFPSVHKRQLFEQDITAARDLQADWHLVEQLLEKE